jgi:Fe-S-cluster-containing dehydrogenase component
MERKGLMIDYQYCTGCHSCEIACKQEHHHPVGRGGLYLHEIITECPDKTLRIDYLPFPTQYCNLCAAKTTMGEPPACVKHCQASTMYYGSLLELAKLMETRPCSALFAPR